jgi:hypothetical protein
MSLRTRRTLASDFRPVEYPAGSEASVVEVLDAASGACLLEIRVPDLDLVGGASYDIVTANLEDVSDATEQSLMREILSAVGEPGADEQAAEVAKEEDVPVVRGDRRPPRQPIAEAQHSSGA